jgi:ATP-dependent Clp protease ATP-binding subunit ClpB
MVSFEKFTVKAQEALASAQELAFKRNHTETTPVHLLFALVQQNEGVVVPVLKKMGVVLSGLVEGIERSLARLPRLERGMAEARPSLELQETIRGSMAEAEQLHDEFVSTEHLFLALVEDAGGAGKLLKEYSERSPACGVLRG